MGQAPELSGKQLSDVIIGGWAANFSYVSDIIIPILGEKNRERIETKKYHSFILEIDIIKVVKRG